MAEPARNQADSAPGKVAGNRPGTFQPGDDPRRGKSPGRPKGLAKRVREIVGDDADLLVAVMANHATGWNKVVHPENRTECWERVSVNDQRAAIIWLAERGFGKAIEFVPIEEDNPLGLDNERARSMSEELFARADELAARRREREEREAADG